MNSKRAQKAKKRAKREARRQTRRAHSGASEGRQQANGTPSSTCSIVTEPEELAPYMDAEADVPTATAIGYMAYDGIDFLRKNGECIVAGSATQMQRTAAQVCPDTPVVIRGLSFDELYVTMEAMGGALCFDDKSYARFVEAAQNRGMIVGDLPDNDLHLLFRR